MLSQVETAFVEIQRVAHLATADASGHPHVVPVCFAYDGRKFYIAIDEKPKSTIRLKRLRNCPRIPKNGQRRSRRSCRRTPVRSRSLIVKGHS